MVPTWACEPRSLSTPRCSHRTTLFGGIGHRIRLESKKEDRLFYAFIFLCSTVAKIVVHHLLPALGLGFPLKYSLCRRIPSVQPHYHSLNATRRFSSSSKVSMSFKAGIVGLPTVGKSTLFNAVVENGKAQAANFPFCTIKPNVGNVAVPDQCLHVFSNLSKSQRAVPAFIEFIDIAGLVKGASQEEGLGNKFLSHIREVDSILQVHMKFGRIPFP